LERLTGKKLNKLWDIGAEQCFYTKKGKWYHPLTRFPGALCDKEGYIYFPTEFVYRDCDNLRITAKSIHVIGNGISDIPEYKNVVEQSSNPSLWGKIKQFFTGG